MAGLRIRQQLQLALLLIHHRLDIPQHTAQVVEPFLTAWELLGLLQRPEPQGTPVVHRQLEPQPSIGIGDAVTGHLLALDAVLEAERFPGQPAVAVRAGLGIAPHRQRVGGAFADLGQLVGPLLQ